MADYHQPVAEKLSLLEAQWNKIQSLRDGIASLQVPQGSYAAPAHAFESALRDWIDVEVNQDPDAFAEKISGLFKDTHRIHSKHGGHGPGSIQAPHWLERVERHIALGKLNDPRGVPYDGDLSRMQNDAKNLRAESDKIASALDGLLQERNGIAASLATLPEAQYSYEVPYQETHALGGVRHAFRYATSSEYRLYSKLREDIETRYGCTLDELKTGVSKLSGEIQILADKSMWAKDIAELAEGYAASYRLGRLDAAVLAGMVKQPAFELLRQPQIFDSLREKNPDGWAFGEHVIAGYQSCGAAFRVAPVLDKMSSIVAGEILSARQAVAKLGAGTSSRHTGQYYKDRAEQIAHNLAGALKSHDHVLSQVEQVLADGDGPLPQLSALHKASRLSVGQPAKPKPADKKAPESARKDRDRNKGKGGISFAQRAASAVM